MKILIIDDHALFREGLRYILMQLDDQALILEAASCDEAVEIVGQQKPLDLLLLDLSMHGTDGIHALSILRDCASSVPIVIVSASEDRITVEKSLAGGAQGFIPKSSTSDVMISALRLVLSGGIYIPPLVLDYKVLAADASASASNDTSETKGDTRGPLTLRQLEVLSLMCKGYSNKQLCRAMGLAEGTVKTHVAAILKSLNVTNRTQAVLAAQECGLLTPKGECP